MNNIINIFKKNQSSFKNKYTIEDRIQESYKAINKYPDRIPVICEKSQNASKTPDIDKTKYLVPFDLTIGQFMYVIRKRLKLPAEQAIFFFINGMIPASSHLINQVYNTYKDEDGFLYISYSCENTFG